MKIRNIGISLLLASSLFANNTLTDTTNKLKNDIKKDGTNINFVFIFFGFVTFACCK